MHYSKLSTDDGETHELDSPSYGRSVRIALPGAAGELNNSRLSFCTPLTTLSKPALVSPLVASSSFLLTVFTSAQALLVRSTLPTPLQRHR